MKVLIAASGTGGHVFPGIAVATALKARSPKAEIIFVGTSRGMENKMVGPEWGGIRHLPAAGVMGKGLLAKIKALLKMSKGAFLARRLICQERPDAIFSVGGYLSAAVMIGSAYTGVKRFLLEPNAMPGATNRLLARMSDRIFLAFEEASEHFSHQRVSHVGNPLREDILAAPVREAISDTPTVLVFGGSQGAHAINEAIKALLKQHEASRSYRWIHQTGEADLVSVRSVYEELAVEANVQAFFSPMADALAQADVVIARSGSSILELGALGLPSILIPYPYAADDHQACNANVFQDAGASIVIDQNDLGVEMLSEALDGMTQPVRWKTMHDAALRFRFDDAAAQVAEAILKEAGSET